MPNVFTYGSLMFDSVWSLVVEGSYDRCEAILQGYDRKGVRNEVYPVIVPATEHSQVQGIVYLDVSASDLARLNRFEGEYYFRKKEEAVTPDMKILPVEVFVLKEEYYAIISPKAWDPEHFSTTGIHFFMHTYMDPDKHH
ncbi:MAG: hypothetical protein AMJ60_03930 [Desulfobacterales bacterium SG8_35]|nr:MAG: hypothetical protein AMJ60_03930 [Desulfobacterales bacterium SG8_35]